MRLQEAAGFSAGTAAGCSRSRAADVTGRLHSGVPVPSSQQGVVVGSKAGFLRRSGEKERVVGAAAGTASVRALLFFAPRQCLPCGPRKRQVDERPTGAALRSA